MINDLDLAAGPTAPEGVDVSPRPFSVDGSEGYSPGSTGGAPSMSQHSGNALLAGAAGGYTGQQMAQYYHPNQAPSQGHYSGGGAPSVVSSGSVYPASEAYSPTSVSGGAAAGRAARLSKQQEAARAYAEVHPDYAGAGAPGAQHDPSVLNSSDSGDRRSTGGPLTVANPEMPGVDEEPTHGPAAALGGSATPVLQHRDGGRVRVPENDVEIPPSYDSIPANER